MQLWRGREKAKAYIQLIQWESRSSEITKDKAHRVYLELYGQDKADAVAASMSRVEKELEAEERVNRE